MRTTYSAVRAPHVALRYVSGRLLSRLAFLRFDQLAKLGDRYAEGVDDGADGAPRCA